MKLLVVIALLGFISISEGFFGFTKKYNNHEEPFISHTNRVLPVNPKAIVEKWIEQRLDNFNPQDTRVWQMRYLENDVHYQPGGPIFIYVGGEWTITSGSISAGTHIYDMAQELNGTLFYTEHRFYGRSHPTNNTDTENLRFLSIDQALADLAFFITQLRNRSPDLANAGVIMVGGSYSATMVAWMRKKYPHLVSGSWASSAPLHAQVDFFEYKDVMTDAVQRVGGDECSDTFENAFRIMEDLVAAQNVSRLETVFNLCQPMDLTLDVHHFFYELSDMVAGLVQSHRAGRIESGCDYMHNIRLDPVADDLDAFAGWVKRGSSSCLDLSYNSTVLRHRQTDWDAPANQQMRQWTYQTCTEFAWFQTSTSTNQIFGTSYPIEYFVGLCQDLYDYSFDLTKIERNVERSNTRFGGFDLNIRNVYFTHGDLDPWHPMGILEDLNEWTPVSILPLSAHVSDLGSISTGDSAEMTASKERIRELVHQWLNVPIEGTNKI